MEIIRGKIMWLAEKSCDLITGCRKFRPSNTFAPPKVIVHRGAWDLSVCRENTLPAFQKAKALGVYGVELDVRFTKDNVPIVLHDPGLGVSTTTRD